MSIIKEEFKLSASSLLRLPGFSLTVITTLAVTLAALAVVLNINYLVLTKPLPYPNADKLLVTDQSETINGETQYGFQILSAQYHIYRDEQYIDQMALLSLFGAKLRDLPNTPYLRGVRVTPEYFTMLDVPMHLGRAFNQQETINDKQRVVVLSFGAWQTHFGGDPQVIGSYTTLGNNKYQIIGVTASHFNAPEIFGNFPMDAWFSFDQEISRLNNWGSISGGVNGIAILKDGVSIDQANSALGEQINHLYQSRDDVAANTSIGTRFVPIKQKIVADSGEMALLLLAGVITLLFIAVTNICNLFLSRAVQKKRIMAIQAALGAKTQHIYLGMFSEALLLCLFACVFGLLIAGWSMVWLASDLQYMFPRMQHLTLDPVTISASVIVSVFISIVMAKLASQQVPYKQLNQTLQSSGKGTGAQISSLTRNALVALQVGLATALLLGASTVLSPAINKLVKDVGFNANNVNYLRVDTGNLNEGFHDVAQQVKSQLKSLPQVEGVALTRASPLHMGWENYLYDESNEMLGIVSVGFVDENNFDLLGIPMLEGRTFSRFQDAQNVPQEIIISKALAERLFKSESAIGQTLQATPNEPLTVVGVVGNIYVLDSNRDRYFEERYYLPFEAGSRLAMTIKHTGQLSKVQLVEVLKGVNPRLSVSYYQTLEHMLTVRLRAPKLVAILTISLIALALILAAAGIYGVLSYSVQMRRYELGIHLSLGAHTGHVIRMVLMQSMKPVLLGILIGSVLSYIGYLVGTRFLSMHITGEITVLLFAIPIIVGISTLACYLPVCSVVRADPLKSLRNE
ncbi:ABC transporter permease [Pseudoalteromonas phenolica]|uniref:ABC transporter permease n=1 Tax=Pseudoalteromonas phenolica TaxID=161398 RepID=UPI002016703C|nr:ABC transporter permease [Pseudoalteromonas phenolica]